MTKIQTKIYLVIFIFLILGLFAATFSLVFFHPQNNQAIDNSYETIPIISVSPIVKISWIEAVDLIQSCQIRSVFQKRNKTVTMTDKKNQVFETVEPNFNDIFDQTNHLRSDCNDIITTITE